MGRKQDLSLASRGCTSEGTVAHEFIHAIGFHHEQNRPDRDKYVKINWHNIRGRMKHNFEIQRGSKTFNVRYDGRSIMHYFSTAFGGSRNTIEAKPVSKFLRLYFQVLCTAFTLQMFDTCILYIPGLRFLN